MNLQKSDAIIVASLILAVYGHYDSKVMSLIKFGILSFCTQFNKGGTPYVMD